MFIGFKSVLLNQRTIGPVNAHIISEQLISTKPGYKWLKDFLVQDFILISEPCSAKAKGTSESYTFLYSLSLLYQPISRPHAAKFPSLLPFPV